MRRLSLWGVLVVAGVLMAAACGGDGSGEGVASATGSGDSTKKASASKNKSDPQQAGLEFARCMREHGVDVPDPTPGQGGFAVRIGGDAAAGPSSGSELAAPADDEAFQACKHILDDALGEGGGPPDPEAADRALKFAQCMREHGINMPDPEVSGGRVAIKIFDEGMDPSSPALQEAHKACEQYFGPPGGAGGAPGLAVAPGRRS